MPHPDAIADCVLQAFRALSPKFKPRKLADGRREWVPLAGIVLRKARYVGCTDVPCAHKLMLPIQYYVKRHKYRHRGSSKWRTRNMRSSSDWYEMLASKQGTTRPRKRAS